VSYSRLNAERKSFKVVVAECSRVRRPSIHSSGEHESQRRRIWRWNTASKGGLKCRPKGIRVFLPAIKIINLKLTLFTST